MDMVTGDIGDTLRRMTAPMVIGMIMLMSFSLVDTYFVSLLGTNELAAMSFTFPVTFTIISLNIGLGIGTSAVIGKFLGSGDRSKAKALGSGSIMLSAVLVSLLCAVAYFLLPIIFAAMGATDELLPLIYAYMNVWLVSGVLLAIPMVGNSILRASGDTKTPSIIMATGGGINAALDPILIFGFGPVPALGIQGAAIATCIAWAVCSIWILYLLAIRRGLIESRLLNIEEFKQAARGVLSIGLPAAGANMLTPVATGVVTAMVAAYGAQAVAAWGVGGRLESIASILVLALSMTLPPFISQNFGANQFDRIEKAYKLTLKFVLCWQLFIYGLLALFAPLIAGLFAKEQAVSDYIELFLYIVPLAYGLQGIVILTNSSFNALHLPMSALMLNLFRLFVSYIPIVYIGGALFGIKGLFWGGVLANCLTGLLAYGWFNHALAKQKALHDSMHHDNSDPSVSAINVSTINK